MSDARKRWTSLTLPVFAATLMWTVVFPWLEHNPLIKARIEHMDRTGIDPAACFYTDLDPMTGWELDIAAARGAHPEAFWSFGPQSRGAFAKPGDEDR